MANNRIAHFEIPANQPEVLTKFHSDLFGWKFQKAQVPGPEYWLCDIGSDGPGSDAAAAREQPWMDYVDDAGIGAVIEKATELGAVVALAKTPVAGAGAVAAIVDPQGNICGLREQATPWDQTADTPFVPLCVCGEILFLSPGALVSWW